MGYSMKKYLIQVKYDDGTEYTNLIPYPAIIDKFGMRDCSGEEIEVYDVSKFGTITKLAHRTAKTRPNCHIFYVPGTAECEEEVVFSGESPEH